MMSTGIFVYFVFNETATTEIYTYRHNLSVHDALPILFVVLRRSGASATEARAILLEFADSFGTSASVARTALSAADLVVDHKLQYWDALIVTAAADAGCTLLLSEDRQHGFVTRGLTIVNPFAEPTHPKLSSLLETTS